MQSQYDQSEILSYYVEEGDFTVTKDALVIPGGEKMDVGVLQPKSTRTPSLN